MTLVFGLEGQEGCKVAANILYGFDSSDHNEELSRALIKPRARLLGPRLYN